MVEFGWGCLQQEKTRIDKEMDSYTPKQHFLLNDRPFVPCSTTFITRPIAGVLVPVRSGDSTFCSSFMFELKKLFPFSAKLEKADRMRTLSRFCLPKDI